MAEKRSETPEPEALPETQLEKVNGGMNKGELIEWLYEHARETKEGNAVIDPNARHGSIGLTGSPITGKRSRYSSSGGGS